MTGEAGAVPEIGDAVADVLRAAYYYALFDGHRSVRPGMVLVAAARNDSLARPLLGAAVADARSLLAAPGEPPDSADPDAVLRHCRYAPALREAAWWVYRGADEDMRARAEQTGGGPVWTSDLCEALDRAAREAETVGAVRLGISHLLVGLLDARDHSIRSLANTLELNTAALTKEVRAKEPETQPEPFTPVVDLIAPFGAIEDRNPWLVRWIPNLVARLTTRDRRWGGPVLAGLEAEILRQAVRSGHQQVQSSAVLLATISLDEQLQAAGRQLRRPYVEHNQAGRVLMDAGINIHRAQPVAEGLTEQGGQLPAAESAKRFWGSGKPGDPVWGQLTARVLDRAGTIARQLRHDDIGTSHLLAASLEEEDSSAAQLLAELGGEPERIRQRLVEHLAG